MNKHKVVPISDGVQPSKRQRVRIRISKGPNIQIRAELVADDPASEIAEAGVAATRLQRKYWIAADGAVHVLAPEAPEPPDAVGVFAALEELAQATAGWKMRQFVSVWNQLPDMAQVSRFENRQIAVTRLWQAIERVGELNALEDRRAGAEQEESKPASKTQRVISLLQAPGGVTLQALMKATGWQAHSVRGLLSGKVSKQLGLQVASFRRDGERVYQLPVPVDNTPSTGEQE